MPTQTFYRFEGGPLDGQERKKTTPARTPLYLTTEGIPLDVNKGGRVTNSHYLQRRPKAGPYACYARRGQVPMDDRESGRIVYRYVYTVAFDSEREENTP